MVVVGSFRFVFSIRANKNATKKETTLSAIFTSLAGILNSTFVCSLFTENRKVQDSGKGNQNQGVFKRRSNVRSKIGSRGTRTLRDITVAKSMPRKPQHSDRPI